MKLDARHTSLQRSTQIFRSHIPVFRTGFEAKYHERLDYPDEHFGLFNYGEPGVNSDHAQQCELLGASLVDISMVNLSRGKVEPRKHEFADLSDFSYLLMNVFLYDIEGHPFIAPGDHASSLNGSDCNDYTLAFGRECAPFAVQTGQADQEQTGWFSNDEIARANKHELTPDDCTNILDLYELQATNGRIVIDDAVDLMISSYSRG